MNLALRKIIYDPISYIHPQRVSLNNTPINNPVLRSITNEMIVCSTIFQLNILI